MRPRRAKPGKVIQMDDIVACGDCSRQPQPASWGEDHDREAARSDHAMPGEEPRNPYPKNTFRSDPMTSGGGTHSEESSGDEGERGGATLRLLMERASCRDFTDAKIPPHVLQEILADGIQAPTGGNLQPYSIIKIEEQTTKDRLAKLCEDQLFIARAPVDLLFCGRRS